MDLNPKSLLIRYWYVILLVIIVLVAFSVRAIPARFNELQALDPFLFYRMSEYALNNNWELPKTDMLRYYPDGINSYDYVTLLPVYIPALSYSALSATGLVNIPYLQFAIIFPAIMGAIAVFLMYFIGKDLFKSRIAGLFAAFFLATVPAFLTRTTAGFFEKEPIAGVFMMLTVLFFIKAFKKNSWKYSCIAGVSFALMSMTWGGAQYIYLLMSGFLGLVFGINLILVVINYLFAGCCIAMIEKLEDFVGLRMIMAYVPMMLIGIMVPQMFPSFSLGSLELTSVPVLISFAVIVVLLVRYGVKRLNLLEEKQIQHVIPGIMVLGVLILLVGSVFSGALSNIIYQLGSYINPTPQAGELGTTIAENMPGGLGEVTGKLSNSMSGQVIPQLNFLSPYFTLWIFMILGCCAMVYEFYKTKNYLYLFPLLWIFSSIWSVFAKVRLTFLVGPAAAVGGAFFFAWLIKKARKDNIAQKLGRVAGRINTTTVLVSIIIALTLVLNFANAYAYCSSLGPSICFPMVDEKGNVKPCLEINADSTYSMDENQPWYQAMDFLSTTGQDNAVLSWWDFGYWFQARGNKPSIADGGNLGEYARRNNEIAEWFTSSTNEWSEYIPWLQKYQVGYILMDYTLIAKFGAITSIASKGQNVLGFMEFRQSNTYQKDNQTIVEFTNNPFVLWVPVNNQGVVTGSIRFMVSQDGKYYNRDYSYINDVCTTNGILHVGDEEPSVAGCVVMSSLGIYYAPEDAKDTIFTNLMFMDGYGLPLEKVFDNTLVKIYKVLY